MSSVTPNTRPQAASTQTAQRLRRPSWRDPRLLLGVLIVLLSVGGVVLLLAAQDRTVSVYAADRQLSTGDQLAEEDLRVVDVRLPGAGEQYLAADAQLPEELQLTRMVGAGELLPAGALAEADPHGRRAVTVTAQHDLARAVQPGRLVEVWAATNSSMTEEEPEAQRLVVAAEVTDVRESQSTFATAEAVTVELLVPDEELSELLTAIGEGATVSVLPTAADAGNP